MNKLNLGCSDRFKFGYINSDLCIPDNVTPEATFQQADLTKPWPWPDGFFSEIVADDIIEHLPDKIFTMNEIHRVLTPGGRVHIFVPTTEGRGAWQDPTHVSYWNRNSFLYFTHGDPHYTRFSKAYGVKGSFQVISEEQSTWPINVTKLAIVLEAVK